MTEKYGDKVKLAERLAGLAEKVSGKKDTKESKEALKKRFQGVSNLKLMRLDTVLGEIDSRWGTHEKLIDAYLLLLKRDKDVDYRRSLMTCTPGRLVDLFRAAERRGKRTKRHKRARHAA